MSESGEENKKPLRVQGHDAVSAAGMHRHKAWRLRQLPPFKFFSLSKIEAHVRLGKACLLQSIEIVLLNLCVFDALQNWHRLRSDYRRGEVGQGHSVLNWGVSGG